MRYLLVISIIALSFLFYSCEETTEALSWNFKANFSGDITYKMDVMTGTATKTDNDTKITIVATGTYNGKNLTITIITFGITAKTYNVDVLNAINECSCVVLYDGEEYLSSKGKINLPSVGSNVKGTFEFKCYSLSQKPLNINSGSFNLKVINL